MSVILYGSGNVLMQAFFPFCLNNGSSLFNSENKMNI
jgi:hypothetical protein